MDFLDGFPMLASLEDMHKMPMTPMFDTSSFHSAKQESFDGSASMSSSRRRNEPRRDEPSAKVVMAGQANEQETLSVNAKQCASVAASV